MRSIILNGPCGVGKSTVARLLHERMPLSVLFDVDAVMRWMSGYALPEHTERRRRLTFALSKAILTASHENGHDVIMDKMIFESDIVDQHIAIARRAGADVYEFILWAPKDVVMERAIARGFHEGGLFTKEKCELFWQKIDDFKERRSHAVVIDVSDRSAEQVADELYNMTR